MSNDIEVGHGGVVEVDTAQLWNAAVNIAHQARRLADIEAEVAGVHFALAQLGGAAGWEALECARRAVMQAEQTTAGLSGLGAKLGRTAEEYEEVELRVRWELARLQGDDDTRLQIEARAHELGMDAAALAEGVSTFGVRAGAWWKFVLQYAVPLMGTPLGGTGASAAGLMLVGLFTLIHRLDRGTVRPGAPLGGAAKPVVVRALPGGGRGSGQRGGQSGAGLGSPGRQSVPGAGPVGGQSLLGPGRLGGQGLPGPGPGPAGGQVGPVALSRQGVPGVPGVGHAPPPGVPGRGGPPSATVPLTAAPTTPVAPAVPPKQASPTLAPPSSLAAMARRIPSGAAQVGIEQFTMPGGRTEWGVYIAGTRTGAMGGSDPWDMQSNSELYFGERSASSDAVFEAMRAAGVQPGDPVHLVGHSQGGMIAAGVAVSGEFSVGSITTFGSPVDAEVSDSVLSVRVRHDDDPVAALAGVGSMAGSGSADSVVVTRTGDPQTGVHDLKMPTHGLDEYARTADLYQSSGDPRARAVDRLFARLGQAEGVVRTEFVAERAG